MTLLGSGMDLNGEIRTRLTAAAEALLASREQTQTIMQIARECVDTIKSGGKILWCGNGGSAADCQHLATELTGRFERSGRALASLSLTTDTSALTAISNDFGFDHVFSRQVEALGRPGDLLVCMSTSGNSPNVLAALTTARCLGITTVAFLAGDGGHAAGMADLSYIAPTSSTAHAQQCHITIGHIISFLIEMECR